MTAQPAGEHHTGTLNLAGQGNPEPSPISDEAVEVATRMLHPGLFESDGLLHPALAMSGQVQARQKVRAALEAAYPAIRQQVAGQIAAKLDERYTSNLAMTGGDEGVPREGRVGLATGYQRAAQIAREIGGGQ